MDEKWLIGIMTALFCLHWLRSQIRREQRRRRRFEADWRRFLDSRPFDRDLLDTPYFKRRAHHTWEEEE